ncbi:MAG: tRNA 2-thiouridine(34) synthase MnmA [bacterium]
MTTVAIGMSGGLDSSVCAHILRRQTNLELFGFTMRLGKYEAEHERTCCNMENLYKARKLCDRLGINHYTLDMEKEFGNKVIQPFLNAYLAGETPNPCSICNREIKMNRLLNKVLRLGADRVATGHYVQRIGSENPSFWRGIDPKKDQSYYLALVNKEYLERFWFPLGFWKKSQVLTYAEEHDLAAARSTESQSLCFAPERDYRQYIRRNTDYQPEPGDILNVEGEKVGEHTGYINYTIGQRRGLGISHSKPLFVLEIKPSQNELVVGERDKLSRSSFTMSEINWLGDKKDECSVQLRYNSPPVKCWPKKVAEGWKINLSQPVEAVTPGQVAAFYAGDRLLGGGRIKSAPLDYGSGTEVEAKIKPRK